MSRSRALLILRTIAAQIKTGDHDTLDVGDAEDLLEIAEWLRI